MVHTWQSTILLNILHLCPFLKYSDEQPVKINMEVDMLNYLDATHKTYFNHVDETGIYDY